MTPETTKPHFWGLDAGSGEAYRYDCSGRGRNSTHILCYVNYPAPKTVRHTLGLRPPVADCQKAGASGLRSVCTNQSQALSRPDTLAHDSRKASLGKREYPQLDRLPYWCRSWGKGRGIA